MPDYDDKTDQDIILIEGLSGQSKGAVERREAAGQVAMVNSSDLPTNIVGVTKEEVTKHTGIQFGEEINDLFTAVILPEGWKKQATEHSMWSDLLDEKGRKRAGIFYKAAFYDRRADISFNTYWNCATKYEEKLVAVNIKNADDDDHVVKTFTPEPEEKSFEVTDRAQAWLDENYPENRDVWAYWT